MIITADQFISCVRAWIGNNRQRVDAVWTLKGGWEAWAQTEICSIINTQDPTSDVLREQPIYSDRSSVDFLVNDTTKVNGSDVLAIEMKCESLNNAGNFIEGLRGDMAKLENKLVGTPRAHCTRIVLGLFFSPEAQKALGTLAGFKTEVVSGLGMAYIIYKPA